jgi:hypothetical protein
MKTKTFGKKLVLNKETIADISPGKMDKVQGGAPDSTIVLETIDPCEPTLCRCTYTACFISKCPDEPC